MKLTVSGGVPSATPGLRLPASTFQATLTRDNGTPPTAAERIWLHAMEGSGGFGPVGSPLQSYAEAPPATGGVSQLPEIVLGPNAEPNRFVAQARNAHAGFSILGDWTQGVLKNLTPVDNGICHEQVQVTVELRDKQFPASTANPQQSAIAGARLQVEVTDFGGWLVMAGRLTRAAILQTDSLSQISFGFRLSSREETSIIRVYVLDAPNTRLDLQFTARAPKLLSCGTATRQETTDKVAANWLSKLVRVGTVDSPAIQVLSGPLVNFVEIGVKNLTPRAKLYPEPRAGWGGMSSLMARPSVEGTGAHFDLWLPDFPDEATPPVTPVRAVDVPSQDRYSGPPVVVTSLPFYIESGLGGVRGDARGVEIRNPVKDVQYLGPQAQSSQPFKFDLATKLLPGAPDWSLLKVRLRFKVRMTPSNSLVDDPTARPDDVPGTICLTKNGQYADEQFLEIQVANPYPLPAPVLPAAATQGPNPAWILPGTSGQINLYYKNSDRARDCDVEVTATATIEQKIRDPKTRLVIAAPQTTQATTILARAFFPCPRLSFTKASGNFFVPIDDEGIIPSPLIDAAGNVMAHDAKREFYLEYRAEDPDPQGTAVPKPTVKARLYGGSRIHDLKLTKVSGSVECAIFRSDKIVCYLERPEPNGLGSFTQLDQQPFQAVLVEWAENPSDRPYGLSASLTPMPVTANPKQRTFWTPIRPLTFLNIEAAGNTDLTPDLPAPEITLDGFNNSSQDFTVTLDTTVTPPVAILPVSGTIRDLVGDLTRALTDRINQVDINGTPFTDQTGDVVHITETASKLRPYAAYEKFTGKVTLRPGFNVVQVSAVNKLGVTATRTVQVELMDSRNAFDDATTMKARVTITARPRAARRGTPLAMVHYRTPHALFGSGGLPGPYQVDVKSLAAYPDPSATDQISVKITRDARANENVYISEAILLVPDTIDQQIYAAAKALRIQLLKQKPGARLMVSGTLKTSSGDVPLQNLTSAADISIRMLVLQSGQWKRQERLRVGDHFTFEADYLAAANAGTQELLISSCDRLGRVLPGPDRRVLLVMSYDSATNVWKMTGYEDLAHGGLLVSATKLVAVSRHGEVAPGEVPLRALGGGVIQAVERLFWSVDHDPQRQSVGGVLAPQDSMRGTSARMGANNSVLARTGELVISENDITLNGRRVDLSFTRTYRAFFDYDGPIGYCWSHSLEGWLHRLGPDTYQMVGAGGRLTTFSRKSAGTFFPDQPGVYAILEIDPAHVVRVRWAGGDQEVFAPRSDFDADYLPLIARYDRCRNKIGLVYNQSGTLTRAEDPLGQPLHFHHDDRQCVDIVGDGTERVWNYGYWDGSLPGGKNGDLQFAEVPAVTWANDPHPPARRNYSYDLGAPHKLATLQDAKGTQQSLTPLLQMNYFPDGRVHTQQFGDGTYIFAYAADQTVLLDRKNNQRTFDFKPGMTGELDTLAVTYTAFNTDGTTCATAFVYNAQGEATSITPPAGSMTPASEFDFDDTATDPRDRGNVVKRRLLAATAVSAPYTSVYETVGLDPGTDPSPTSPATLEWVYDCGTSPTLFQVMLTARDHLQRTTTYRYDFQTPAIGRADGNLLQIDDPPVQTNVFGGGSQQYNSRWIYDNFGQPLWQISAAGVVTQYQYFPADTPNGGLGVSPVSKPDKPSGHLASITADSSSSPPTPQPVNRSASLTSPEERKTDYSYDSHGYPAAVLDGARNRTTFVYDEIGHLKQRNKPDGPTETFYHDANGEIVKEQLDVTDLAFPAGVPVTRSTIVTTFDRDRIGQVTTTTADPGGLNLITQHKFDPNGNLIFAGTPMILSPNATPDDQKRYTKHEYDGLDRLVRTTVAPDVSPVLKMEFDYFPDGKLKSSTDANAFVTFFAYNCWGYQVEEKDSDENKRRSWRDSRGHVTFRELYGSLAGSSGGGGQQGDLSITYVYLDEFDRERAHVDLVFRYDANFSRQDIGRRVSESIHDAAGNVVETISPRQYHVTSQFNGHGQMRLTRSQKMGETAHFYDGNGNLTSYTVPPPPGAQAIRLGRTYDGANRMTSDRKLGGGIIHYYYDSMGRLRITEDQLGNRTFHEYDNAGRHRKMLREMRDYGSAPNPVSDTIPTEYIYDLNNNLKQVIDGAGGVALEYTYDVHEQVSKTTLPDDSFPVLGRPGERRTSTFLYHPNGLLKSVETPDHIEITHEYTAARLLKQRTVTGAAAIGTTAQTFRYDGAGRCIQATDDNGDAASKSVSVDVLYDSLNNVWEDIQRETISGAAARTDWPKASFSDKGELVWIIYPGYIQPLEYEFDEVGRPLSASGYAFYKYEGSYLTSRTNVLNGVYLSVSHSPAGLLNEHKVMDNHPVKVVTGDRYVEWNAAALPISVEDLVTNEREEFVYDSAYRLRTSTKYDANFKPIALTTLRYDWRGNSTLIQSGGKSSGSSPVFARWSVRRANNVNQIGSSLEKVDPNASIDWLQVAAGAAIIAQSVVLGPVGAVTGAALLYGGFTAVSNPGEYQYFFDPRGNTISTQYKGAPQWEYGFDAFNRMISATDKVRGKTIRFYHDAFGRRVVRDNTAFAYLGKHLLQEFPGDASYRRHYFYASDDLVGFATNQRGLTERYSVHDDRGGSVVALVDGGGDIRERYTYDHFGKPTIKDAMGTILALDAGLGNYFFHQGQYFDVETGLYLVGNRYYDPFLQRFLQADSYKWTPDTNRYTFAGNNPACMSDSSGAFPLPLAIAITIGIAALGAAAIETARQCLLYINTKGQAKLDPWGILAAGAMGAGAACVLLMVPELALPAMYGFAALGTFTGLEEIGTGNTLVGAFDIVLAFLPFLHGTKNPFAGPSTEDLYFANRASQTRFERAAQRIISRTVGTAGPPSPEQLHRIAAEMQELSLRNYNARSNANIFGAKGPEFIYRSLNEEDMVRLWERKSILPKGELKGVAGWNAALLNEPSGFIHVAEVRPSELRLGDPLNYAKIRVSSLSGYISQAELLGQAKLLDIRAARFVEQQKHGLVPGEIPFDAIVDFFFEGHSQM